MLNGSATFPSWSIAIHPTATAKRREFFHLLPARRLPRDLIRRNPLTRRCHMPPARQDEDFARAGQETATLALLA
ncbi:hypothetical protein ACLBOM_24695 [Escherichia coli]